MAGPGWGVITHTTAESTSIGLVVVTMATAEAEVERKRWKKYRQIKSILQAKMKFLTILPVEWGCGLVV